MSALPTVQQHPASVDAYIRHGFSLVPIPQGTKGPRTAGWNIKANAIKSQADLPQGWGIGLAHAYSGTMAFDIDEWDTTAMVLGLQGINLQSLYDANDAVIVDSGRAGHGKLLYKMPLGMALPSKKIIINGITAYELRCATANGLTVQDVLPPSIHPDTKQPYRWAGKGHWMRLPELPQSLLDLWHGLLEQDKVRTLATGDGVDASWDEIRSAIESISPDCSREEWVNVGMALHWAGTHTNQLDQALHLWDEWSKPSNKYPSEKEIINQWVSFKSDKATAVKLGTLFHIAKQHGWSRPTPDVSEFFKAVGSPDEPTSPMVDLRPRPPRMDVNLWPAVLTRRATEIGQTVGCDPLVPLFAGLAAVCGVVDARTRLELIKDFKVPPVLWLMTIGAPADKKTPGSAPMLAPLKNLENEDRPRFAKDFLDWEGREAMHAAGKKAYLDFSASAEAVLDMSQAPTVAELPPQPVPLRITVDDVTSQKLVRLAADRPRGLLCALDEMNSWVRKLTDKSSGEDRSAWVKAYESSPYEMDRVGSGSIFAENLAVSIYGNIQPRVFRENLHNLSADGLVQRFVPCILDGDLTRKPVELPEFMLNKAQWEQTLRIVFAMPAMTYQLSPEARALFDEFQEWYDVKRRDERLMQSDDTFMTAFGKIEGLAGRLMLMFHLIEAPFSMHVSADIAERVIELVKGYVIPAFRYALCELSDSSNFDSWLRDHIIQHCDTPTMTLAEIKRSARRQIEKTNVWQQDQMIYGAMYPLEQARWVMRMDDGSKENQHHAQWAINPALAEQFKEHRTSVIRAKQRQMDEIYKLSTKEKPKVKGYKLLEE
jgi:Protein of unknown function (DUF3987)/Primase C terminal 2 (PriCT-2)/Bifunctional DNA primase/polymerase, N-terminal